MTDSSPSVRDSLAFLRSATRPGSIEARKIYACSCTEDPDRARAWNPDDVSSWQADINLECPAHGRLLEQYIADVNASMGRTGIEQALLDQQRAHVEIQQTRARRRSLVTRFEDAWRGMVQGWRGA